MLSTWQPWAMLTGPCTLDPPPAHPLDPTPARPQTITACSWVSASPVATSDPSWRFWRGGWSPRLHGSRPTAARLYAPLFWPCNQLNHPHPPAPPRRVLIATSYCAYMAARLLWAHRASIPFIPSPHLHAISIPARLAARVSTAAIYLLSSAPWWLAAAYYIFSASSALLLAMGALLVSQLRYLSLGITYVEFLQHGQREAARLQQLRPPPQQAGPPGQARGAQDQQQGQADPQAALPAAAAGQQPPRASARRLLARLAEIFGSANPATWLLPRWQPPAGTFVHACKKLA